MEKFKVETPNEVKIWQAAHDAILITGIIAMLLGVVVGYFLPH